MGEKGGWSNIKAHFKVENSVETVSIVVFN